MKEEKLRHKQNLYLILDISPGVSHNEILHAYNRAKTTYSSGSLASYTLLDEGSHGSILDEIEGAFAVLGNPAKRRAYDIEMGFNTWVEGDSPRASSAGKPSVASKPSASRSEADRIASSGLDFEDIPDVKVTMPKQATVIPIKTRIQAPDPVKGIESKFEANAEFERQIAEVRELTGAFLRAVRIYRKYTADTLAHRTKLSSRHVDNIENENTNELHEPVYLRGHLVLICQALDLPNPNALAKSFIDRIQNQIKQSSKT